MDIRCPLWKYNFGHIFKLTCPCLKEIQLCVWLCKKIQFDTYLCTIMLALPHTTHNSKMTWCRGTSAMASTTTHGPPASVPAQCTSSPLHGQCLSHSVCLILRWGVCCVTFLSLHFKANFCQSGAMSSTASAATHGSLPPILVQCACSPHHGWCLAHSVCFILQLGLLGAPKCNQSKNR